MDGQRAAATLGVGPRATRDEIRQAFRAKAKVLHPDVGSAGSAERFIGLRQAFDRLMADAPVSSTEPTRSEPTAPESALAPPSSWASAFESGFADRFASTIDLSDSAPRRSNPAGPGSVRSGRTRPVKRDARGMSFADHLSAAMARP